MASEKKNIKANKTDFPVLFFETNNDWRDWLEKNHSSADGVWLRLNKKNSGLTLIFYAEALDEALCYGWIDGQLKTFDEKSYIQKFTPRRSKSIWSKKNIENFERLVKAGKMRDAGQKAADSARDDGWWDNAYDSPSNMEVPEDFLTRLSENKKASAFFKTLNKANTYAIAWRLQTAKRNATREMRIMTIIEMLERGEKFH
jgi:uncharacterized protein YdeI (YjbR/CyaY-like superfamily)